MEWLMTGMIGYVVTAVSGLGLFYMVFKYLIQMFLKRHYIHDFTKKNNDHPYTYGRREEEDKIPPVFPNGWIPIIDSQSVPVGKVASVTAVGQKFAVFRGEDGECRVAEAWCPHLGANLGVGGFVEGNCIRCPFHMWAFDGRTGECTDVPYTDKAPSFAKLKLWKSVEISQFVFIWYHADNEEPTWTIPEPKIEPGFKPSASFELIFKGYFPEVIENGADHGHFTVVHGSSPLSGTKKYNEDIASKLFYHSFVNPTWKASEDESTKHISYAHFEQNTRFFNMFSTANETFDHIQLGPAYAHSKVMLGSSIHDMEVFYTPVEPLKVRVFFRFFSSRSFFSKFICWAMAHSVRINVTRDIYIWSEKCYNHKPILAKGENISQFRRWFDQFYSESSLRLHKMKNSLEW